MGIRMVYSRMTARKLQLVGIRAAGWLELEGAHNINHMGRVFRFEAM